MAMLIKSTVFRVLTPCIPEWCRWFGRTFRLHVQCRSRRHARHLEKQAASLCRTCVLTAVVAKSTIFWDITPYNPLKVNRRFGCLLPTLCSFSCLAYSSILKMEAYCSKEMSVDFQRITQRYIPVDRNFQAVGFLFLRMLIAGYPRWRMSRSK
jgi:hypothetical protein